ncbi:hypothetical protein INT45_007938 [Circinella minor]|uniref:Uncharacterized protein n=1 Tax=Circinella minor TaxID=1195481 RepID=A0A8H7VQ58_9FUNG|nr:hypothetical protein INT45_007938 [Circinella minor]
METTQPNFRLPSPEVGDLVQPAELVLPTQVAQVPLEPTRRSTRVRSRVERYNPLREVSQPTQSVFSPHTWLTQNGPKADQYIEAAKGVISNLHVPLPPLLSLPRQQLSETTTFSYLRSLPVGLLLDAQDQLINSDVNNFASVAEINKLVSETEDLIQHPFFAGLLNQHKHHYDLLGDKLK